MHVLGARFRTASAASAALLAIRASVAVAPGDSGVRPLGSTRYEEASEDYLLAGRFADEDVAKVTEIVEAEGGRIIEQRRELLRPAATARLGRGAQAAPASNPPWSAAWMPAPLPRRSPSGDAARHATRMRRPGARLRVRAARAHRFR